MRLLGKLISDDLGASAAEYAMLVGIIGGAIVLAALALGAAIGNAVDRTSTNIETCGGGC